MLAPWLVFAAVAGAATARGAGAGLIGLLAVTAGYLLLAGPDASGLWLRLVALALIGGPTFGWAGLAWRRGRAFGPLLIGLALVAEGAFLQLGDRSLLERAAFGAESCIGLVVSFAGTRNRVRLRRGAP